MQYFYSNRLQNLSSTKSIPILPDIFICLLFVLNFLGLKQIMTSSILVEKKSYPRLKGTASWITLMRNSHYATNTVGHSILVISDFCSHAY